MCISVGERFHAKMLLSHALSSNADESATCIFAIVGVIACFYSLVLFDFQQHRYSLFFLGHYETPSKVITSNVARLTNLNFFFPSLFRQMARINLSKTQRAVWSAYCKDQLPKNLQL